MVTVKYPEKQVENSFIMFIYHKNTHVHVFVFCFVFCLAVNVGQQQQNSYEFTVRDSLLKA